MNRKVVVDSSVIVKWVNSQDEKLLEKANELLEDARSKNLILLAPELAKYEVGNVLWKKGMELPQTLASLGTAYSLPIKFVAQDEHQAIIAMEIIKNSKMSFYDASFVSLAKISKAELVTDNVKHQGKFEGVKVIALSDYK